MADPEIACSELASAALSNVAITRAEFVPTGGFRAPGATAGSAAAGVFADLPAFCRVGATLTPVEGSEITMELWLPAIGWNGKFLGAGNGGFAGAVLHAPMAAGLARGYAVANNDTGHQGDSWDASFANDRPEAMTDFAYRAVHEMTVASKALAADYYGDGPAASYWLGCSTGGRQGLANAQLYPEDYDAIVAGAPANNMARLQAHSILLQKALTDPAGALPTSKLSLINEAAIAACDADDGVVDRIIARPGQCDFDPGTLACEAGDAAQCLTPQEVDAARSIYAGVVNPTTGEPIYPAAQPGSELSWVVFAQDETIGSSYYRNVVFNNPNWDYHGIDFDADVAFALDAYYGVLQTQDPDIAEFVERGGKLLLWHGWTDPLVTPGNTVNYYESVRATIGPEATDEGVRLFMAPSVNHCGGGDGAVPADLLGVLEAWAEQGDAPETMLASRAREDGSTVERPLCRYPLVARYDGSGDPDDAASFSCVAAE